MRTDVFCVKRPGGGELRECLENRVWFMEFCENGSRQELDMYSLDELEELRQEEGACLLKDSCQTDSSLEELLADGKDRLGEALLKEGEPSYEAVKGMLPPIQKDAYTFLSGALSWGGVLVSTENGAVYPQSCGSLRNPGPLFAPVSVDRILGAQKPRQFLLNGQMPLLLSVHCDDEAAMEFLFFVEPGDPDRDPILWIRMKRYLKEFPERFSVSYRIAALSRETVYREIKEEDYYTALADTVVFWKRFSDRGAQMEIPEKELKRVVYGTQMFCAITFSGDHAHYGHKVYGEEVHDNFPPSYLWTLEACFLFGRDRQARRIWQHLVTFLLTDEGRFVYRQGEQELFGASAEEYGQLLFLTVRYQKQLGVQEWTKEEWEKIIGMGRLLLSNCRKCEELEGRLLILMCAEADTNTRVHAYVNNNLWGIRGLWALAELLRTNGRGEQAGIFQETADLLWKNVRELLAEQSVEDARFGNLPPFRFGYTAAPATLSTCKTTFSPMTEAKLREYLRPSHWRAQVDGHELTENTYANYRYYPEMLSAMLMEPKQAAAVVKLRENIGGEFLGMTRFYSHLDDWPVLHYARYLLEAGWIEKYILLLYAHTCHHGIPELMCYYEQVTVDGRVVMPDCVPSLLTAPVMTGWMFVYETIDEGRLSMLRGVPLEWFAQGFSVSGMGYSQGTVDLTVKDRRVSIRFSAPLEKEAELVWRLKKQVDKDSLLSGHEFVERMDGNRLVLKKGITGAELEFN